MSAERVLRGAGRLDLRLLGQRQLGDLYEAAGLMAVELLAVERGALEQVGDLAAVRRVVEGELLLPGRRLDLGRQDQPGPSP